ncbi:MAG: hypothetical protein EP329_03715 [Deltaproteobacteria bacterium]|nr:MAG: hypothetical protein EP329_03715 [Deltaproteobacteria bacterium]
MTNPGSKLLLALSGLALTLVACGDDNTQGADPNRVVLVDTQAVPDQIEAGGSSAINCAVMTASNEVVTARAFSLVVVPPEAATVAGLTVTSTHAGTFTVACHDDDANLTDDTPVTVTVTAAAAHHTVLTLDPATLTAGASAQVGCFVADQYGNATADATFISYEPTGLTLAEGTVTGTLVGEYHLTCDTNAVGSDALGTGTLTIVPGAAAAMTLQYVPEALSYALDQPVRVEGVSVDAYGNVVSGEPITVKNLVVSPTGHETIFGDTLNRVRFDLEGKYTVTAEADDGSGVTATRPLVVDQTPPVLTLTSPERGLVIDNAATIHVAGTVSDNLGEVEYVMINDNPVTIAADGSFDTYVGAAYGLNLLFVEAADPYGLTELVSRAAEQSSEYFTMDTAELAENGVDNAVALILTQEAIDDGDHEEAELDDLASLFKLFIDNVDVEAFITNPLTTFSCIGGTCSLDFSGITTSSTEIALTLQTGKIHMHLVMNDFAATITLWAPCSIGGICASNPLPLPGSATSTKVVFDTDIVLSVSGGQTVATAENTVVSLQDFGVNLNDPTGILQGLVDGALAYIQQPLVDGLETLIAGLVEEQVGGALAGLFDAMNVDQAFDIPSPVGDAGVNTVQVRTSPAGIDISPERLQLRLNGIAIAQNPQRPHDSAGSIGHAGCAPYTALTFPPPEPMVVGLHDSFINELLFAVWEGGTLSLQIEDASSLGFDIPLQNLKLAVDPLLPPVYNSCGHAGDRLQLGDLYLDLQFDFGGPAHIALWLQAEATIAVGFGVNEEGANEVQLNLGDFDPLVLEVVQNEGYFAGDDQAVVDLITSLVPQLLSTVTDKAHFALPAIDLSSLTSAVPAGTMINLDVRSVGRDNAYLTVNGALK